MQVSRFTRRHALAAIAATLTVSAASVTLLAQAQINGAGATFPQPDLLEVVLRVRQDQAWRRTSTTSRSVRAPASAS